MILIPLLTITSSAEQAPKIAIYTKLVCETHNPQNTIEQKISLLDMINTTVFRNGECFYNTPRRWYSPKNQRTHAPQIL